MWPSEAGQPPCGRATPYKDATAGGPGDLGWHLRSSLGLEEVDDEATSSATLALKVATDVKVSPVEQPVPLRPPVPQRPFLWVPTPSTQTTPLRNLAGGEQWLHTPLRPLSVSASRQPVLGSALQFVWSAPKIQAVDCLNSAAGCWTL